MKSYKSDSSSNSGSYARF